MQSFAALIEQLSALATHIVALILQLFIAFMAFFAHIAQALLNAIQ